MLAYEEQITTMTQKKSDKYCRIYPILNSLVKSINPKLLT